ncbi:DUF3298 domain-containing protein [Sesbania bispinosa]|nr:DUF3298 domain-containing protein [Sesbania bispinosa]
MQKISMCPPKDSNRETVAEPQAHSSEQVNPNPTLRVGTNLGENLHGDWIVGKVEKPTNGSINVEKPTNGDTQLQDRLEKRSGPIKSLPHNIQTSLDVVFVRPNRLRFVDEPKPPDLSITIVGADSAQVDGVGPAQDDHGSPMLDSMDEVLIEDCVEEDQEMVADTFANQDA